MTKSDIKKELNSLQQRKRSVGNLMMTQVLMLVLIIVLLFTADIRVVYTLGAATLLYILMVVRPNKNRYTQNITALECLYGLGGDLNDCCYEYVGSLPRDLLEQTQLVSPRQWDMDAVCRHRVEGNSFGAHITVCEASFALRHGPRKSDMGFVSGTWIQVQLPKATALDVRCISRGIQRVSDLLPDLSQYGLCYVPFADKKLREAAYAFTPGEDVPGWLEKQFSKLCGSGARVMLSICADQVGILVESRFYAAKHKLSDQVTEQTLSFNRLPEKAAVLELIRIIQRNAAL